MASPGSGVRWSVLAAERPELAEAGRVLLYQFGVGLAFLGTVRKDGGPRVHPVCPLITADAIYMFVTASYKRRDDDVLAAVRTQFLAERGWIETPPPDWADQQVFQVTIEWCLLTRTTGHGDFQPVNPGRERWASIFDLRCSTRATHDLNSTHEHNVSTVFTRGVPEAAHAPDR